MKNPFTNIAILIITSTLLLLFACNKPAYKYNKEFEGNWLTDRRYDSFLGDTVRSQIFIEGVNGKFNNTCLTECLPDLCGCVSAQGGKAVMNSSKTQMKIGSSSKAITLTINEEPNQDELGKWQMKVNGLVYFRQ